MSILQILENPFLIIRKDCLMFMLLYLQHQHLFFILFHISGKSKRISIGLKHYSSGLSSDFFYRKWLMITIAPVVYGLMRYIQDIYEKHEGESPEKFYFLTNLSDYCYYLGNFGNWNYLLHNPVNF